MGLKTFTHAVLSRLHAALEAIVRTRLSVTLWAFVFGFVMCIVAVVLNVASVSFDGQLITGHNAFAGIAVPPGVTPVKQKEVGYLFALNWSLFGVLITPLILWFGMGVLQVIPTTLHELCETGMLRDKAFKRVSFETVEPVWSRHLRNNRLLFAFVFICVMAFMLYDWWQVVATPLLHPESVHAPLSDPQMEYDWSVAWLFNGVHTNRWGLFVFGLFGYAILGALAPAFAFAVCICALHFVGFVATSQESGSGYRIAAIPSQSSDDHHCGFSVFFDFFNNLLIGCIVILFGLWLMLVQNTYLRDLVHENLFVFVLGDVDFAYQMATFKKTPEDIFNWLVAPAANIWANTQTAFVLLIFPFVCVIALGLSWFLLRNAALKARGLSLERLRELATETKLKKDVVAERLNGMEFWPVGWLAFNELIIIAVIMFGALASYRIMIVPIVWVIVRGCDSLLDTFRNRGKTA